MKNKKLQRRLYFLGGLFLLSFLIYSCLSDETFSGSDDKSEDESVLGENTELTVSKAEQWYNANNPQVTKLRFSNFQEEILIRPQWSKAKERRKGDCEIVETPLLVDGSAIFMDSETLKNDLKISQKKIRNIVRLIVRKDLKTGQTRDFIMIIRGSYDYLAKTNRLGYNNYFHREPDFDGDIYFYEVGQGLRNGFEFQSGKLVATIALGMEENCNTRTNVHYLEDCYLRYIDVVTGEYCDDNVSGDAEFGGSFSVCETNYRTEIVQICPGDPVPIEPWEPGPWGPHDDSDSHPPVSPACAKSDEMTDDNVFLVKMFNILSAPLNWKDEAQLKNILSSGSGDYTEWMGITDNYHHEIRPSVYKGGVRLLFKEEQLEGKVFDEWYHIQALPGIGIPLLYDLKELGVQFQKGRIKTDNFVYGIISQYGCLCMMITSIGEFDRFTYALKRGELDAEYNKCIQEGNGKPEKQRIGLFIKFLEDNYAGLTFIYGYPDPNNFKGFYAQTIDSDNIMINDSCE